MTFPHLLKVSLLSILFVLPAARGYAQENGESAAPETPASAEGVVYQPTWDSLGKRPIPAWFEDAKFGIFIHWGPYSVPAWAPRGIYSEWYQTWLQDGGVYGNGEFDGDEVIRYHNATYGEDFSYYQFADQFTADLFEPDQWAALFERSGAKYVVLTSKHHDGFTLWPNEEASKSRGFDWNSVTTGAKRDLVGELSEAVKKTDVKMGLYYSLYEWYHPLWQSDRAAFVDDHFHPQFKDLVQNYEPDLVWADGQWDMHSDEWKSQELVAWLFNESPVGDYVVINDRWGSETRKEESFTAGYLTTEFDTKGLNGVWEECRGMG